MANGRDDDRAGSPLALAAAIGAGWGAAGYTLLWGHTSLTLSRRFVTSAAGTAALLPVRTVLGGIRLVEERIVGHPFDFSRRNSWIGALAALVGAGIAVVAVIVAAAVARRLRAGRGSRARAGR